MSDVFDEVRIGEDIFNALELRAAADEIREYQQTIEAALQVGRESFADYEAKLYRLVRERPAR
jgi:hypothetical protein